MLRTLLFCGMVFASASSQAFINPGPSSPITKVQGADLFCSYQNTSGAISIDVNQGSERVWWGESGQPEALQLSILSFDRLRCLKCYRIQAQLLLMGEAFNVDLLSYNHTYASGEPTRTLLNVNVTNTKTGESQSLKMDCGPLF